jgi:hypothetical protein
MALACRFEAAPGYLYVETTGSVPGDLEGGLTYIEAIRDAAIEHERPHILIDRRLVEQRPEGAASDLLLERVADLFLEQGYGTGERRIAVVTPADHLMNVQSAQTLFNARGLHMRYYGDIDTARSWLQGAEAQV